MLTLAECTISTVKNLQHSWTCVYTSNLDAVCQLENIFFLIGFFKILKTAVCAGACDITLYLSGLKELVVSCLIVCHGLYLNTLSAFLKMFKFVSQKL